MRIIKKDGNHDYYDVVQAMGQDLELVYIRNPIEEKIPDRSDVQRFHGGENYPFPYMPYYRSYGERLQIDIRNYTVGFCGRLYPILRLSHWSYSTLNPTKFCYNLADVDEYVYTHFRDKETDDYRLTAKQHSHKHSKWAFRSRRECFEKFFNDFDAQKDNFKHCFDEHKCPVFIGDKHNKTITWNGCLKDVEFFRIKDAYTAFQDISVFLNNQARPQKEIPVVSNNDRIELAGFDTKFSFRKPKRE